MSDKIITFGSHSRTSANLVDRPLLIDESQSLLSSSHVHYEATLPVEAKKTAGLCHKIGLGILIGLATITVVPGLIWLGVHLYQRHQANKVVHVDHVDRVLGRDSRVVLHQEVPDASPMKQKVRFARVKDEILKQAKPLMKISVLSDQQLQALNKFQKMLEKIDLILEGV